MKKRSIIIILLFIILLIPIFLNSNKENIIKDLTFKQIEDKNTPLNYKKEYTFLIKELKNNNNSLEFNVINHIVEVYINDKLIFELKEETKENKLIKIALNQKHINKKVKIVLTPISEENLNNDLDIEIK